MDDVDVGGLRITATIVGLNIRIGRCWCRRLGGTGGIGGIWQERFDEILIGAQIRSWYARRGRSSFIPLESHLSGDVGGVLNGVSARAAPDFVVSMSDKETCDDDPDDRAEHETTNA